MRPLVRAGALLSLLTVGAGSLLIGSRSPAASESRPEVVISDVELGRLLFWDPVLSEKWMSLAPPVITPISRTRTGEPSP